MIAALLALVLAQPTSLNLNGQPLTALRCDGGVTCARLGSVAYVYGSGPAASSGPPVDGGFVLWGGSVGSTNERTLSAGNYTVIDNATASQTQVDWQHGLTCAANERLTTSGTTAMTCSQVAFSDLSGSATTGQLPTIPVTKGGTNLTTIAANQTWVGTAVDTVTAKTLPSCSNATTSKLLYDNATQTFSCGTDQGGSGSGITYADAVAASLAGF